MSESKTPPQDVVTLVVPKQRDYASQDASAHSSRDDITSQRDAEEHHDSSDDTDTTATNSSDEFNWDEDDEEVLTADKSPSAKRGRALYLAFMKLARPIRILLIGIIGAGILVAPLLVFRLKFNTSPAQFQVHIWSLWMTITWVAGVVTYLVVDAIPRLVVWTALLFRGKVERLKIQVELVAAVAPWLKLTLDISWMWIALASIRTVYKPSQSYWVIVNRVMQALFAAGILLLAEKLFLHFVAINFHQKALADRLTENRLGLKALDALSNVQYTIHRRSQIPRRAHKSPMASVDFSAYPKSKSGQTSRANSPTKTGEKISRNPVTKIKKANKKRKQRKAVTSIIVDNIGEAIGQVALKNSSFNREADLAGLHSARRLARQLFSKLSDVEPPRSHLIVEDFEPYFRTTAEAHEAFKLFDKDNNGDISKREMREAVQRIYRERKALVSSLKDVSSAVAKLDAVLIACTLIVMIFICLLIFNRENTLASLVPLASIILGFSFMFGHSAQMLFESLIFIFSTHVFDVGDLVLIDDQPLFVREFGLFSTTFRRVDGQEIIAPNSLLSGSKLIHNLRRSNSMWETTNLQISYSTPLESIEELRGRLNSYVNENSREWSNCAVNIDKMEYQNSITLIIAMEHRSNWQDWGGRWGRRNGFMRHLKTVLEELNISYSQPVQPVLLPMSPLPGFTSALPSGSPPTSPGAVRGTSVRMQQPRVPHRAGSAANLGNAGTFQGAGNEFMRAPGGTISSAPDNF